MTFLLLVVGLALLLSGGYAVVLGASQLARSLGVPSFVVGLTVVAFGTSAPELAVNALAAMRGEAGVSFGNVVGSNLANIGLILGVAGVLSPLAIDSIVLRRELPMMLLATTAAFVMVLDPVLTSSRAVYDRSDGLLLLLFFSVFLYTAAMTVLRRREADVLVEQSSGAMTDRYGLIGNVALLVAGLVALVWGADVTVEHAARVAVAAGVPSSIIGLSVVAVGTSLPELVASVIAAVRDEADLAIGNIVGSNIFNLLFILGVTSTIASVPMPAGGLIDLAVLAVLSVLVLILSMSGRRITRFEAAGLAIAWLAYLSWRLATG